MSGQSAVSEQDEIRQSGTQSPDPGYPDQVSELIRVIGGRQSGAWKTIDHLNSLSIGSDLDNDIVLRDDSKQTFRIHVERDRGQRLIQLASGQALLGNVELVPQQWYRLEPEVPVTVGSSSFELSRVDAQTQACSDETQGNLHALAITRRPVALAAVLAGCLLLGMNSFQDRQGISAENDLPQTSLRQQLDALGFHDLEIVSVDSDADTEVKSVITGRVGSRENLQALQHLLAGEQAPVDINVQVDADLIEGVQDVYRNHGIVAQVDVLGVGHVQVDTEGVDQATLNAIEQAIADDLPSVQRLDIRNTPPPESEPPPDNNAIPDPAKEIEAVVAGDISYVITRDQARYFVGAVLPSGHTITSISDGAVVMHREGEETRVSF